MADKQKYMSWLDEHADIFSDISDKIWEYAELSLMEYRSCELYVTKLKEMGFEVESPLAGVQTGFKATYGSGSPVIGILAEYDALTGLSQVAGATHREERSKTAPATAADTICWAPVRWRRPVRSRSTSRT